jgi:Spy/CpxP family protein refolding chaperone
MMRRIGRTVKTLMMAALPLGFVMAPVGAQAQAPADPPSREDRALDRRGDRDGHDRIEDRIVDRRGAMERAPLSDEQRRRIEDIHFSHRKHAIEMKANLESATLELERLMHADSPDRRAIDTQIDRIAGMRASLIKERVAGMFEVRSVLTPEQRREWRERFHRPGMEPGMRHMRGMHGPGSPMEPGLHERGMHEGMEGMHEGDMGFEGEGVDEI